MYDDTREVFLRKRREVSVSMKKKLHVIAIEYPAVTVLILICMIGVLTAICKSNYVDMYYEVAAGVVYDEDSTVYIADIKVPKEYYEGIREMNRAIWYTDLEAAVYEATIRKIEQGSSECKVVLEVQADKYEEEPKDLLVFKVSYAQETVFDRLISEIRKK